MMYYDYHCPHTGLEFNYQVEHGVEGCGPPNECYTDLKEVMVWVEERYMYVTDPSPQLEESLLIAAEEQDANT